MDRGYNTDSEHNSLFESLPSAEFRQVQNEISDRSMEV